MNQVQIQTKLNLIYLTSQVLNEIDEIKMHELTLIKLKYLLMLIQLIEIDQL